MQHILSTQRTPDQRTQKLGFTPLHLAVIQNDLNAVTILTENSADVNIKDVNNLLPVYYAQIWHEAESTKVKDIKKNIHSILLEKGSNK